eukprot:357633-Chlamydomonas_euryale.AAC.6
MALKLGRAALPGVGASASTLRSSTTAAVLPRGGRSSAGRRAAALEVRACSGGVASVLSSRRHATQALRRRTVLPGGRSRRGPVAVKAMFERFTEKVCLRGRGCGGGLSAGGEWPERPGREGTKGEARLCFPHARSPPATRSELQPTTCPPRQLTLNDPTNVCAQAIKVGQQSVRRRGEEDSAGRHWGCFLLWGGGGAQGAWRTLSPCVRLRRCRRSSAAATNFSMHITTLILCVLKALMTA